VAGRLLAWIASRDCAGYDPFDGLNSPVLRAVSLGHRPLQILCLQLLKRLPVNLRPLLGVRPGVNPKALGLMLTCHAALARLGADDEQRAALGRLRDELSRLATRLPAGPGWGYNFDWPNRSLFVPRGTPTAVNTAYIVMGLCDAFVASGDEAHLDLAAEACGFLLSGLNVHAGPGDSECCSYTPLDQTRVHNANALTAAALHRVAGLRDLPDLRDCARRRIRYVLDRQRPDGAWTYGEAGNQGWIDSFHTGYNLLSLLACADGEEREKIELSLGRGLAYYLDAFILPTGDVKYYHDRAYPLDAHAYAHALVTLCHFAAVNERGAALVDKVESRLVGRFLLPGGAFGYQKTRWFANDIPYMRWVQVWVLYALLVRRLATEATEWLPWGGAMGGNAG
jgi:hypothetical protein